MLVALPFISNSENKESVDQNKGNNRLLNLKWATNKKSPKNGIPI